MALPLFLLPILGCRSFASHSTNCAADFPYMKKFLFCSIHQAPLIVLSPRFKSDLYHIRRRSAPAIPLPPPGNLRSVATAFLLALCEMCVIFVSLERKRHLRFFCVDEHRRPVFPPPKKKSREPSFPLLQSGSSSGITLFRLHKKRRRDALLPFRRTLLVFQSTQSP